MAYYKDDIMECICLKASTGSTKCSDVPFINELTKVFFNPETKKVYNEFDECIGTGEFELGSKVLKIKKL